MTKTVPPPAMDMSGDFTVPLQLPAGPVRWPVDPLDGLNPEQRRAAEAVRGPVCILAGAGSGKTTTITRRIAQQVAAGAFAPKQIMAVTFTDKAGGRAAASGSPRSARRGVRAWTFHSAALAAAAAFRARRSRADPAVEGARSCARSRTGCRRRSSSGPRATWRPRSSGRRTAASRRSATREARRPRAADPARPDAPRLP